ncbi:MAG: hypothetical protein E6J87_11210 [Deltaproteobacteria bacterium]|nr:MAG: hypothetical protein E6J87_11210 [Deltaproteobacteria bacterium]
MRELGRAGQRQRDVACVALDLHGQVEDRADQHDALLARAERGQEIAQPAQRDRVVEPAMDVEHREHGGILESLDRLEPGVERAGALAGLREPGGNRPGNAAAFRRLRDALEQGERALLLEGLEDREAPARAHERAQLVGRCAAAHSVSTVTRATSS